MINKLDHHHFFSFLCGMNVCIFVVIYEIIAHELSCNITTNFIENVEIKNETRDDACSANFSFCIDSRISNEVYIPEVPA